MGRHSIESAGPHMQTFSPHLEILPGPQRKLWDELSAVPKEFVLYGGTALALHLGHRDSIDFDFFGNRPLNVSKLETGVSFLSGARVVQREENTFSAVIDRDGLVKVSFFGVPKLPRLATPHVAADNGLQIASLLDLAGTKASVVQMRAEAKDYFDIDALLRLGRIGLPTALAAAQKLYGPTFNPEITLKALSYFDDGNLRALPEEMKSRLVVAAREVDVEHLPEITGIIGPKQQDYGIEL
jgi:hypothetical protein